MLTPMLDRFATLAGGLDHPEGVTWRPGGDVYAGGEAGQVYAVTLEGELRQLASTGGFVLGLALDGEGRIYACDVGRAAVVRVDPETGSVETYSAGSADRKMTAPNWLAFGADGSLYVTDSGNWGARDGFIWRIAAGGEASVWTTETDRLPNGCCLGPNGDALYVIETNLPGVVRVPINPDGSAGRREVVAELPGTTPDGLALAADGSLVVACYRPDAVLRIAPDGRVETLVDDPDGQMLGAPTNVVFVGEDLDQVVVSNFNRWHLAIADLGLRGAALHYPSIGEG
jgi:gluconolactonase